MKEVDTNVDNFSIGAHGSSMQTRVLSKHLFHLQVFPSK
jgi:hypothetical protein